jgi:hypothetical protein
MKVSQFQSQSLYKGKVRWWYDLSQKEKLLERLLRHPKDFTFQEASALLNYFGYKERTGGKTSGSRIAFANDNKDYIRIHKPHPRNILKPYQLNNLINDLTERGFI